MLLPTLSSEGSEVNIVTSLHVIFGALTQQELVATCMLSDSITQMEV